MIDKMTNYILDKILYKDEKIDEEKREIMAFGITRILEDIPKAIIIISLSIYLGIIDLVAIVFIVTLIYKTFIGGAHARTNISCLISTTIFFLAPVVIGKYINFNIKIWYIIYAIVFVISIYVILKIAPADTEEVPIINKKKRKLFKIIGFVNLILIYIFVIISKNVVINNIIISTICFIDIFATKPLYRLFKSKYSYESEEFKEYFQNTI